MKTVTVNLKLVFELEEIDNETIKETIMDMVEYQYENDELIENAKIKIVDNEVDDNELDFEDED